MPPHTQADGYKAILAADIAGYARLMELDEIRTRAQVMELMRTTILPTIATHHGAPIERPSGECLAAFGTADAAIACGQALQQAMAATQRSDAKPLSLRIGLNIGDVAMAGGTLTGDAVSQALQIKRLAEPGSVFLSADVKTALGEAAKVGLEDVGEAMFKPTHSAARVFKVTQGAGAAHVASQSQTLHGSKTKLVAGLVGAGLLLGAWRFLF